MGNKEDYYKVLSFQEDLIGIVSNPNAINDYDYDLMRDFLIKKYSDNVPEFLKNCRSLSSFKNKLMQVAYGDGSWKLRRDFIYDEFEDLLNFLEFGKFSDKNKDKSKKEKEPIKGEIKSNKNFNHKNEIWKTIYWILGTLAFLVIVYFVYKMTGINLNI